MQGTSFDTESIHEIARSTLHVEATNLHHLQQCTQGQIRSAAQVDYVLGIDAWTT